MNDTRTPLDPQGRHGLEHLLGINGIKRNPDQVNLSTINPTIDMGMQGYARINDPINIKPALIQKALLAPAANMSGFIVSYGNFNNPAADDLVFNVGFNLRIISLSYTLKIPDPTGVLNGKTVRIYLAISNGTLTTMPFWQATHQIYSKANSLRSSFEFNYPGDWSYANEIDATEETVLTRRYSLGSANQIRTPIMPAGWTMKYLLYPNCLPIPDTGYFDLPTGTTVVIYIIGQQVPIGAPLPQYW